MSLSVLCVLAVYFSHRLVPHCTQEFCSPMGEGVTLGDGVYQWVGTRLLETDCLGFPPSTTIPSSDLGQCPSGLGGCCSQSLYTENN